MHDKRSSTTHWTTIAMFKTANFSVKSTNSNFGVILLRLMVAAVLCVEEITKQNQLTQFPKRTLDLREESKFGPVIYTYIFLHMTRKVLLPLPGCAIESKIKRRIRLLITVFMINIIVIIKTAPSFSGSLAENSKIQNEVKLIIPLEKKKISQLTIINNFAV